MISGSPCTVRLLSTVRKELSAMRHTRRWQSLALAAVLALTTLMVPALAAGSTAAASIATQAARVDNVKRNLDVQIWRRDQAGTFVPGTDIHYSTPINRTTRNAVLTIHVAKNGVQVTVEYLTDLNGDGKYELLDGENRSVADVLLSDGSLVSLTSQSQVPNLSAGDYTLTGATLKQGEQRAISARTTAGSGQTSTMTASKVLPSLFLINLKDGNSTTSHYFALYEKALMPADVPVGSWYYSAVEAALDKGYLNGSGPDSFNPDGKVTRAQLAQVLWNLGGSLEAEDPGLADVSSGAWYYLAVSWCCQEELMADIGGSFYPDANISREEVAKVLRECGRLSGFDMEKTVALDSFPDGASVSADCQEGMSWAVANGIFKGNDQGQLCPGDTLTRSQLAVLLDTFLSLQPQ